MNSPWTRDDLSQNISHGQDRAGGLPRRAAGCGADWAGQDQQAGGHAPPPGRPAQPRPLCRGPDQGESQSLNALCNNPSLSSKAGANTSKTNNDGKSVHNMSLDSEVLVVLKKHKVIKDVNNGFNDEEYNNDDEEGE